MTGITTHIPDYKPSYTTLDMEAACCLWEAMLEMRSTMTRTALGTPKRMHPRAYDDLWDNLGTVEMRHYAIRIAPLCSAAWQALTEDEQEEVIPYDWEFCRLFACLLDAGCKLPSDKPRALAEDVLALARGKARG